MGTRAQSSARDGNEKGKGTTRGSRRLDFGEDVARDDLVAHRLLPLGHGALRRRSGALSAQLPGLGRALPCAEAAARDRRASAAAAAQCVPRSWWATATAWARLGAAALHTGRAGREQAGCASAGGRNGACSGRHTRSTARCAARRRQAREPRARTAAGGESAYGGRLSKLARRKRAAAAWRAWGRRVSWRRRCVGQAGAARGARRPAMTLVVRAGVVLARGARESARCSRRARTRRPAHPAATRRRRCRGAQPSSGKQPHARSCYSPRRQRRATQRRATATAPGVRQSAALLATWLQERVRALK